MTLVVSAAIICARSSAPSEEPTQRAIIAEAFQPQLAQALGQPRIDEVGLGGRKMDSGIFVQRGRDEFEILLAEAELAGRKRLRLRGSHGSRSGILHAASRSIAGSTLSSVMTEIMRPSMAMTPRTNMRARFEATSGVGWMLGILHRQDVGDGVDQQPRRALAHLRHDDDVARRGFRARKAQPARRDRRWAARRRAG